MPRTRRDFIWSGASTLALLAVARRAHALCGYGEPPCIIFSGDYAPDSNNNSVGSTSDVSPPPIVIVFDPAVIEGTIYYGMTLVDSATEGLGDTLGALSIGAAALAFLPGIGEAFGVAALVYAALGATAYSQSTIIVGPPRPRMIKRFNRPSNFPQLPSPSLANAFAATLQVSTLHCTSLQLALFAFLSNYRAYTAAVAKMKSLAGLEPVNDNAIEMLTHAQDDLRLSIYALADSANQCVWLCGEQVSDMQQLTNLFQSLSPVAPPPIAAPRRIIAGQLLAKSRDSLVNKHGYGPHSLGSAAQVEQQIANILQEGRETQISVGGGQNMSNPPTNDQMAKLCHATGEAFAKATKDFRALYDGIYPAPNGAGVHTSNQGGSSSPASNQSQPIQNQNCTAPGTKWCVGTKSCEKPQLCPNDTKNH
jgi:hypothetical protein